MLHELKDEELMGLVAKGQRMAFDQLVRRHMPRACAVARRVNGNPAEAEDVVQEAFTRLWIKAPSWDPGKAKFTTWFYRIVVNAGIDQRRARKPSSDSEMETIADTGPDAETRSIMDDERAQLEAAIARLPEKQRLVIVFCYQKEMTNREAAEILGMNIKALEGLLVRARKALKQDLGKLAEEGGLYG
jgi:RNA polymerase sigma-70 factor (ECF subfamily)